MEDNMTVNELIGRLSTHMHINPKISQMKLGIPIQIAGVSGGRPIAEVKSLSMGYDLDKDVYFIHPDMKLTPAGLKRHKNQPRENDNTFNWDDNKVIDFVNWYIDLHQLGIRYKLENKTIVDSFKNGDDVSDWYQHIP
jgi:hypothetical protein